MRLSDRPICVGGSEKRATYQILVSNFSAYLFKPLDSEKIGEQGKLS